MNTQQFQSNVVSIAEEIRDSLENLQGYTETLVFPGYDAGNGNNLVFEGHPTLRGRVIGVMGYHFTEANTDPIFSIGETDVDAYIEEITTTAVSANTNSTTDADASRDYTRLLQPGAAYVIPADQLVTVDSIDGGSDTGIYTFVVVIHWFK